MYPGNESQFGGAPGAGGPFNGGGDLGPPPADGIFESAFEEIEDLPEENAAVNAERAHDFLAVGLHFFEGLKRL
jgi:hypothetical protein